MAKFTENFIVVLDDKKFEEKTNFLSKDFGNTAANVLRGKFVRKLGPTAVISLSDSKKSEFKRFLYPSTSRLNSIYRVHPLDKTRYIAINEFHETVLNEKREEFCNLLKSVGCKFINWRGHPEWNKSYLAPDNTLQKDISLSEDLEKSDKFFKSSSTWQKAIHERLRTWCDILNIDFAYDQDYNIKDALIDTVYDKIGISNKEKDDLLKKPGVTIPVSRTQSNLDANEVYRLFSPVIDSVEVQFFNKNDYKAANIKDIQKKWTPLHVQAFLRVVGMDHLSTEFKEKKVDGKFLFKMTTPAIAQTLLKIKPIDATLLVGFINELGDLEHLDILTRVQSDLEEGDGVTSDRDDLVDKLVVDLGGVGTVENFLNADKGVINRRRGNNPSNANGNGSNILGFDWDNFDWNNSSSWLGNNRNNNRDGASCCNLFSCCSTNDLDPYSVDNRYIESNNGMMDPDDFEWGDDLDPYTGGSVTSAGARSAFTGASRRSDRPYPQQTRGSEYQEERRRKDRAYLDNMSIASSSVSRPGASGRNRNKMSNYDDRYDSNGASNSRVYSPQRSREPSNNRRGLGQRDQSAGVDPRILKSTKDQFSLKIVLTGMPGVGKRRLMRRFGATEFTESKILDLTQSRIPAAELHDEFQVSLCDNTGVSLRSKLSDNRNKLMNSGNPYAQVLLIVFDLTNYASFASIPAFIHQKVELSGQLQWCSIVLLGNKLDLDKPPNGRVVTRRMALELCQKFGIEFYIETSAKTAQNVLEILSVMRYHCKNEQSKNKKGLFW